MLTGRLFGVSVGPGDPELLTLKAIRVIQQCAVIAVPQTPGGNTLALDIVSSAVDLKGKKILYLEHAMAKETGVLRAQYQRNGQQLKTQLLQGKDVALLNLGDISIYSTCSYLLEMLDREGFECKWIPGVTSFCACAAESGHSLVQWDQPLSIFPGSYSNTETALDRAGCKVLMKSGSSLPAIQKDIIEKGLAEKCVVVSDCGLPSQKIGKIADDYQSYFTTIIIRD